MTREFDDRLRQFLVDEGRRASIAAPTLDAAVGRLAPRLARPAQPASRRLTLLMAAALLIAAALGSAIAIGSGRLSLPLVFETPSSDRVFNVVVHYYDLVGRGRQEPIVTPIIEPTRIEARLPEGWTSTATGIANDPVEPEPAVTVSFWAIDGVFTNPCDPVGEHGADPPMMRSLEGVAGALSESWQDDTGWGGNAPAGLPRATDPVATTVSGFRAQYLEVRIPNVAAVAECDRYATWRNTEGVERRHAPGDVSRIWIVEVGPPRGGVGPFFGYPSTPILVVDAASAGEPSAEAVAELEQFIDSLVIEPPAKPVDPLRSQAASNAAPQASE